MAIKSLGGQNQQRKLALEHLEHMNCTFCQANDHKILQAQNKAIQKLPKS